MQAKSPFWPGILMIGSLLLLGAFEGVWLHSVYSQEKELLQEKQTQRLHSAIRELEDSLFQLTMWPLDDSILCRPAQIRISREQFAPDSLKMIAFTRGPEHGDSDTLRLHSHRPRKGAMILGALVRQVSLSRDSTLPELALDDLISEKLHEEPGASNVASRLVTWSGDRPDSTGVISRAYFDMLSGTHYALSTADYQPYLLQEMLPQILFACLLFACIAGAFWFVNHNLRKQRNLAIMRSNLISNITHELKTPISTVHVALEALHDLRDESDRDRREEYLGIAQSEVNRLALLVDKVLKSSEVENGKGSLKIERFDFRDLLTQILDTLKVQLSRQNARIDIATTGEDFTIEADKLHLTGLIHNLLDNAIKYSGPEPKVNIHITQHNGQLEMQIIDHGIGIPKTYQNKIFDQFFRVPHGDTHNIKGHGLGLSYVAQVLKEHHGKISVESGIGSGSTFTVTLPRTYAN